MQYMRWDSLLAIVPVCVSSCGILLTITVIAIFVRHSETPIVKVNILSLNHGATWVYKCSRFTLERKGWQMEANAFIIRHLAAN